VTGGVAKGEVSVPSTPLVSCPSSNDLKATIDRSATDSFFKEFSLQNKYMKKISYKEFVEKYQKPNKDWKFELFKIVCVKCGSTKVEFNGKTETEYGLYGSFNVKNITVIKCHDCGNAFTITKSEGGSIDYCTCDH